MCIRDSALVEPLYLHATHVLSCLSSSVIKRRSTADKNCLLYTSYVSIRANSREQRLIDSLKKRGADGDYQVKDVYKRQYLAFARYL